MSFTQSYIVDDNYCICPVCGAYNYVYDNDITDFESNLSVPIECGKCRTIFYLEKDN